MKSSTDLSCHITSVHEGKKPFNCDICDVDFSGKPNLDAHIAKVHEGKKCFKCEICTNEFNSLAGLENHYITTIHE